MALGRRRRGAGRALPARALPGAGGAAGDERIVSARFASDGREIVLTDQAGRVRVYDCRICGGADELMALARQRLARARSGAGRELEASEFSP